MGGKNKSTKFLAVLLSYKCLMSDKTILKM
jgi:hypothetical protein